jgi:hypothetical protein
MWEMLPHMPSKHLVMLTMLLMAPIMGIALPMAIMEISLAMAATRRPGRQRWTELQTLWLERWHFVECTPRRSPLGTAFVSLGALQASSLPAPL